MNTDAQTLYAQICQAPLFASLPTAEINKLISMVQIMTVPCHTVLFCEDEPGDCLYVVQDGELEVVKALGTEHERLLAVCGAGETIGEISLLTPDARRSASVRVRAEATLLAITRTDFDLLLERYPTLALDLIRIVSDRLRDADNATIRDLREKNEELSRAYADLEAAQQQIIEQEALKRELQHAYQIQQAMLPAVLPVARGIDLGARMLPARKVGGDFYDVIHPEDGDRLIFLVGDVSGKGIPAALFMALSSSLLRADASRGKDPVDVLRSVNAQLLTRRMKSMFVTLFYGELDVATHGLRYARAGHDFPLMWDASGERLPEPEGRSQPLGLFADPVLDAQSLVLPPATSLLLYTDGATEAMDTEQTLFGRERLFSAATSNTDRPAQILCDQLVKAVTDYQPEGAQMDDITFLALRLS